MKWLPLNGRSALVVFHAKFSKVFDIVPHSTPVAKLVRCGLNGYNTTQVRDWLDSQAQRIVVSGSKATWWPITSITWFQRNVISSNIHVVFNHLHYGTEHTMRKLTEDNKLVECLIMLGGRAAIQKKWQTGETHQELYEMQSRQKPEPCTWHKTTSSISTGCGITG